MSDLSHHRSIGDLITEIIRPSKRVREVESAFEPVLMDELEVRNKNIRANRKIVPHRWTESETTAFYSAIEECGLDFTAIQLRFPSVTRRQILTKFHSERLSNPFAISSAVEISRTTIRIGSVHRIDYPVACRPSSYAYPVKADGISEPSAGPATQPQPPRASIIDSLVQWASSPTAGVVSPFLSASACPTLFDGRPHSNSYPHADYVTTAMTCPPDFTHTAKTSGQSDLHVDVLMGTSSAPVPPQPKRRPPMSLPVHLNRGPHATLIGPESPAVAA